MGFDPSHSDNATYNPKAKGSILVVRYVYRSDPPTIQAGFLGLPGIPATFSGRSWTTPGAKRGTRMGWHRRLKEHPPTSSGNLTVRTGMLAGTARCKIQQKNSELVWARIASSSSSRLSAHTVAYFPNTTKHRLLRFSDKITGSDIQFQNSGQP